MPLRNAFFVHLYVMKILDRFYQTIELIKKDLHTVRGTPYYLYCALFNNRSLLLRGEKASCVKSLQWLRGSDADIGKEYEDLAGEAGGGEGVKANSSLMEAVFKRCFQIKSN